jgi:hypothetical protein
MPINPSGRNCRMTLHKGYNLSRSFFAIPYPQLGWGMGHLSVNAGSGMSVSFLWLNHFSYHPFIDLDMGMSR